MRPPGTCRAGPRARADGGAPSGKRLRLTGKEVNGGPPTIDGPVPLDPMEVTYAAATSALGSVPCPTGSRIRPGRPERQHSHVWHRGENIPDADPLGLPAGEF